MTLQWIPLEALEPHPENANVMPPRLLEKLKGHLARTGRYEPLVVRPLPAPSRARKHAGTSASQRTGGQAASGTRGCYQILNGHHRALALRDLGHTHARCDVWDVDDDEARLLLVTLNRLEGRDDPSRRAALVARLAEGRSPADLARLLPEPPDALARLRKLADPPPAPADPSAVAPLPRAMTFFLSQDQASLVREALRAAGEAPESSRDASPRGGLPRPPRTSPPTTRGGLGRPPRGGSGKAAPTARRGEALVRLAEWYLEATGRR